jgi:chemotaxis protein MotB
MARKKQAAPEEKTDGWLTTYADLISLLLCFFVLMYTASEPDEARMQWILRSMTDLSGQIVNPVVTDDVMEDSTNGEERNEGPDPVEPADGPDTIGVEGFEPMTLDDLYNWVSITADLAELDSVSASMQEGRLHIRFDSDIMFGPNSPDLLPEGREALRIISAGISQANRFIGTVDVEGHTAPQPTRDLNDTGLSAARAVNVQNYLDWDRRMVDSHKFSSTGLGPWHPHYPTNTEETNRRNRRVELVITRNDYDERGTPIMVDILEHDFGLAPIPGGQRAPTAAEISRQQQIQERIREQYGAVLEAQKEDVPPRNEFGPRIPGLPQITQNVNADNGE